MNRTRLAPICSTCATGGCALAVCALLAGIARSSASPPAARQAASHSRQAPAAAAQAADTDKTPAQIAGTHWRYEAATGIGTARDGKYSEGDQTVCGATIHWDKNRKQIVMIGQVSLDDSKRHVTADRAVIDYGAAKLAAITGHVIITLKPDTAQPGPSQPAAAAAALPPGKAAAAPSSQGDDQSDDVTAIRKKGAVITCDAVADYYKRHDMTIPGKLVCTQRFRDKAGKDVERRLTADHARYNDDTEMLTLYPPVKFEDNQGQEMAFDSTVELGTKEGAESLQSSGRFSGTILVDKEATGETSGKAPAPPPRPAKP